ncbi:C40 family peptidase [Streptomyces cavernicola]|uniref:C40 family peptidase n=1 Tax=Streptomyces cavernicola TaxID=3043613 RepID=A0ABT6S8X0_9ACTN|nr:C40 family peptidase [Streptomyces sp. B-S-A6]MDI3404551.1 C40 family peptidase [Streptomyces sp. B-S-A6]
MSAKSRSIGRAVCAAAVVAGLVTGPQAAAAPRPAPGPAAGPEEGSVAGLLTDLQELYRKTEQATETYNATAEKLKKQRSETKKLGAELAKARTALHDSRAAAGRLARQQYQSDSELSPYLKLLLARDPRRALDQGHVVRRMAAQRVGTVGRLVDREKKADGLARRSRKALAAQVALAARQKEQRDEVTERLKDVEEMLSDLSPDELAALRRLEEKGTADAQRDLLGSGALGGAAGSPGASAQTRAPSKAGDAALRYAVKQIGKPYVWGAEGPGSFDCSGLTSRAWQRAGVEIPRTSQEQWARLERVPLHRLRPGDLVVYFPEATHVALYLGDGKVVQAPRPGSRVKVSPIAANPLLGAVRPDPEGRALSDPDYRPPELPPGAMSGSDLGYGAGVAPEEG